MSYQATVLKVFIASPSDVPQQRQAIRRVVGDWNAVHSERMRVVLMPIGYETHAVPEMGARPQHLINTRVLANCDLLVAVFWTRIGTSTGASQSGTVEEIEEHIRAEKPVMIYFSSAPVALESVDRDQYDELQRFKNSIKGKGLYETFDSDADFVEKFSRHLAQQVNRHTEGGSLRDPDLQSNVTASVSASLSRNAKELLKVAAESKNGTIGRIHVMSGLMVTAGDRDFVDPKDSRVEAAWEAVVQELEDRGLIEDRGNKREVFRVTSEGYDVADLLPAGP